MGQSKQFERNLGKPGSCRDMISMLGLKMEAASKTRGSEQHSGPGQRSTKQGVVKGPGVFIQTWNLQERRKIGMWLAVRKMRLKVPSTPT